MDCALDLEKVKELLGEKLLSLPGDFIYSEASTLKAGELYILGTNPGDVRDQSIYPTVGEQVDHYLEKPFNHYLGDKERAWVIPGTSKVNPKTSSLGTKLSNIVKKLNRGYLLEHICAANLIFARTKNVDEMSPEEFKQYATLCWQVHLMILEIVQPKVILAFGNGYNSAYLFLKKTLLPLNVKDDHFPSGHGNTQVYYFDTELNGRKVKIFGLPHLSIFSLDDAAIEQISKMLPALPEPILEASMR